MNRTNDAPALVTLAAGLGSRYGDAKQIAGVGPHGEWLLEYAVRDALEAGFRQVVMVIRAELRTALTGRLAPHLDGRAELQLVEQTFDLVPAGCRAPTGRTKPLGTGHALWCCAPLLHGPFAVINADDYYGRSAFRLLADHFTRHMNPAMVGYRLDATLSSHGGVNRGVCRVDAAGHLQDVTEFLDIDRRDGQLTGNAPDGRRMPLAPGTVVSLNCWGLTPALLPDLESGLRAFLAHAGMKDEYFLPHAITHYLAARGEALSVLPTNDAWLGLTYPDDRAQVVAAIAAMHAAGDYPVPLWAQP
ncbi:MAG: Glutamate synthase [NADPH] large chain [Rhodanobacteraceae bacterium]|jgi:NDP-sugar pyrophosphorylase family protein|nr:MAG: Glutamate synthase [NADPH] large chain [Rhodanobacteraceae bacterium]